MFVRARADALPFRDGSIDLVGSFDMIEHVPDDAAALAEQARVVSSTGAVVTAVPADQRLWSSHDEAVGHFRRYDRSTLISLAGNVGLTVVRSTYFFSFLWPPAFALRNSTARREAGERAESVLSRCIARLIGVIAGLERAIIRRRPLPFGTSLWAEFRPSPDDETGPS